MALRVNFWYRAGHFSREDHSPDLVTR
jgi:hypothetical protein